VTDSDETLALRARGGDREAFDSLVRRHRARPFAAWLRTITLNKCRDFGRRRSVRRLFLARFEREQAPLTARLQADMPPDLQGERLDHLECEIAALPSVYKEALLLTVFGDLSRQQAAYELGISVKAIEMRIYRARQRLAARVEIQADPRS